MTEREKVLEAEREALKFKLEEKDRLIVQLQDLVNMQARKKFENMPHRIAEQ